jgi:hypothetical protein
MKSLGYLTVTLGLIIATAYGTDIVPKRTPFVRYQAMLDHSPFTVATAAALPAATPSFAKDLYIANAARSQDGDLVTLASAGDRNFKEYLTTKGPNDHGYGIANIEWSDQIGATKVTISKDGQFASVGFNQALLSVTPGSTVNSIAPGFAQPQPQVQPPVVYPPGGQTTVPQPVYKPAVPSMPTPPPRVRGVIPRNPSAVAQPTPGTVATPPMPPNVPVDE